MGDVLDEYTFVACARPIRRVALNLMDSSPYINYKRLYVFPHIHVFDVTDYVPGDDGVVDYVS